MVLVTQDKTMELILAVVQQDLTMVSLPLIEAGHKGTTQAVVIQQQILKPTEGPAAPIPEILTDQRPDQIQTTDLATILLHPEAIPELHKVAAVAAAVAAEAKEVEAEIN